ncbi:TRAP transporter small permease [Tateyamaria sp. ANG-S1]|uniref:TRAP transporter small permease n=1 Tax=Tateyamaria sp. ANG-S1 TaxID=1577905 RepID=UPI0005804575|nr:TRAP transporter small permease [Tateyamaria sp. ANG-S1]KIC48654.1 hypothetical protein RA29_13155 [Tateyamaria sp. ANG-S1]
MARALDRVIDALAVLAGALLVVVTLLLCVDVAVRYMQIINITWIGDIASVSLFVMTFLAAPWVLREGAHIAVDSLVMTLPDRLRALVERLVNLLGCAICALLGVYAVRVLVGSYTADTQVYRMLVYPQWWLFVLPPVTFALMALVFLRNAARKTA